MSSPSVYVSEGEPSDIDPSNNRTEWFDSMDEMLIETSLNTSQSFAFNVNIHTRTLKQKSKHFWPNWTEFNPQNSNSKADCATLTDAVRDRVLRSCCKHITLFDSSRRKTT